MVVFEWNPSLYQLSVRFPFMYRFQGKRREWVDRIRWRWAIRRLPVAVVQRLESSRKIYGLEHLIELADKARNGSDDRIPSGELVVCPHCGAKTYSKYMACWRCLLDREPKGPGILLMYKYGNRQFSLSEVRQAEDANRGRGGIDLLQPTRHYDKSSKKWYTNPDYVKHYGDPFQGDSKTH